MHAHTYRSLDVVPALYLAHGVTGLRDMGARFGVQPVLALRDSIRAGRVLGPRMFVGGAIGNVTTGYLGSPPLRVTPDNVHHVVDSLAGSSFCAGWEPWCPPNVTAATTSYEACVVRSAR